MTMPVTMPVLRGHAIRGEKRFSDPQAENLKILVAEGTETQDQVAVTGGLIALGGVPNA